MKKRLLVKSRQLLGTKPKQSKAAVKQSCPGIAITSFVSRLCRACPAKEPAAGMIAALGDTVL